MSDTDTVAEILNNVEPLYRALQRIIGTVPWWDDRDSSWNDVNKAASQVKELVSELDLTEDNFSGMKSIDLADVDYLQIVIEELEQVNLDEGRECSAGL